LETYQTELKPWFNGWSQEKAVKKREVKNYPNGGILDDPLDANALLRKILFSLEKNLCNFKSNF